MKRIIILISTLYLCLCTKIAIADTQKLDSVVNERASVKLDALDQLLFNTYAEQELKLTPTQVQALSAQQRSNFLTRFINWIGEFFEPVWGKYREPNHRDDGPYMIFKYNEYNELQMPII